MTEQAVSQFIDEYFQHFNAATLKDAADAYNKLIGNGGKIMLTLAGAMSTAEIGRILSPMIRRGKVHAISCTAANLEEDLMNLVAHDEYRRIPQYRALKDVEDLELLQAGMNRVTDTCIPETAAIRKLEHHVSALWRIAQSEGKRYFPHEFLYQLLKSGDLEPDFAIDPNNSWLSAAAEIDLPIYVPGWEDSTLGNIFTSYCISGELEHQTMRSGTEYMAHLAEWYSHNSTSSQIGFFQIGGGIAGDFPICVVPMLKQDLGKQELPSWSYFCQISDSTTSYGSYSGATPNEKISWGKLDVETPKFIIESDATIVAPLIFAKILGL